MSDVRLRAARYALLPLAAATIFALTLLPAGGAEQRSLATCLICGSRGLADAVLNVALFVPLGIGAWCRGYRIRYALLLGTALSAGIEAAQLWIPGRNPSAADVLFNALGAALGALAPALVAISRRLPRRTAEWLPLAAALLACAVVAATGALLRPSAAAAPLYAQWTPNLGHLEPYRGRVLAVRLGPLPLPPGRIRESDRVSKLLRRGAPLRVRAVAGPPPPGLASVFSVYNGRREEAVLLGVDGHALVFRPRTRAASLRLDAPDLRIPGAMRGTPPATPFEVEVWGLRDGYNLRLNGAAPVHLGFTAGSGWTLLMYRERLSGWAQSLLGALWIAGLALPVGYLARWNARSVAAAGLLGLGLVLIPVEMGLRPTPPAEWAGAVCGFAVGLVLRRAAERRPRRGVGGFGAHGLHPPRRTPPTRQDL